MTPQWIEPELCKLVTRIPAGDNWAHEIKFDGFRMHARIVSGAAALLTRNGLDWTAKYPDVAAAIGALTAGRPIRAMLFPAAERCHNRPPYGGSNEQPLGDLPRGLPTGPLSSETRLCMRRFRARRHKPQPKSSNFVKLLHNYHHHYNYYHYSPDCSAPHSNRVLTEFG
jgi:hypothetical protein